MDIYEKSLQFHREHQGKISQIPRFPIQDRDDLSLAYTPGVAGPCLEIAKNKASLYDYTLKSRTVAVISDGSAVLGLGNIGAAAGLPVMEGKAVLFKRFGDVDAFPICIETQNDEEFLQTVKNIAVNFGGINLEDIAAPRCFTIEQRLIEMLDIPVFHDDQHGTAIVILAAIMNGLKITGKEKAEIKVVISGAGAAGIASAHLLTSFGIKNIILCDTRGAIHMGRNDLVENPYKLEIAKKMNPHQESGDLGTVIDNTDVFIGVSGPGVMTGEMVRKMASKSMIFAMANPVPEIMPDIAREAGAFIIGTGRSDFPNQINNILAFPGIFKGLLRTRHGKVTEQMKIAAAIALAELVPNPTADKVVPGVFEIGIADKIADAVESCFMT